MEFIQISEHLHIPRIGYGPGIFDEIWADSSWSVINKIFKGKSLNTLGEYRRYKTLEKIIKDNETVMIDTSAAYGYAQTNIGHLLKDSKHSENKIICTKLSSRDQMISGSNIRKSFYNSLQRFNGKTIDIYLMHWPVEKNMVDVWRQMEELYCEGFVKCIGVCNCTERQLDKILMKCTIKPMVNQIECHPLYNRRRLRAFCHKENINIMAYTPLARGGGDDRLLDNKRLNLIAMKYNKTIPQIILRWHLENGNIPIVSTGNILHYNQNCNIFDFSLTEREKSMVDLLDINAKIRYDSENCDFLRL